MRIKIIIISISIFLFANFTIAKISIEGTVKGAIPDEFEEKIEQEITKTKKQAKTELKAIENYIQDLENAKINIIDKNGKKIIEINSDILLQEDGHPLFYITNYIEKPFTFYPGEPHTVQFEKKFYRLTNNPIFRFKIKNAVDNKINLSFKNEKIKIKSQNSYVTTNKAVKIKDGTMYLIRTKNIEIPINILPEQAFIKTIDGYKDYEIQEANLDFENNNPYYTIKIKINGKLLWLFQTSFNLESKINAENGKTDIEKPWWESFVF